MRVLLDGDVILQIVLAAMIVASSFVVTGLLGPAAAMTFVVVAFWSWRGTRRGLFVRDGDGWRRADG
jgi:hypothetical protein